MSDAYHLVMCERCGHQQSVNFGDLSDLTVPDVTEFTCDDCGLIQAIPGGDDE